MAKKLTPQALIDKLHEKGWTNAEIARAVGRDSSMISQVGKGTKPGANLEPALRELAKLSPKQAEKVKEGQREVKAQPERRQTKEGKPAKVRGAKGEKPKAPKQVKPLAPVDRATRQLERLSQGGADKVVIYITNKSGTKTRVLGAKGGIRPETIFSSPGGVGGFVSAQAEAQEYEDYDPADWYYEFEEYE